jgi:hypothetical protein
MRRLAALGGAFLLTLVLAAPAAANQRVLMAPFTGPYDFETPVSIADGWDFECSGQIYYGGYGTNSLWLWYANDVDEADMMPEGRAWPWIKGQYDAQGVDYFSSLPDMGGLVASGKYKTTTHQYDHHLGTAGDPNDLETWTQTMTGKNWGIQLPGYGTVFHESGNLKSRATVIGQVPGPYDPIETVDLRPWRGNQTFDIRELCDFFGYDAVFP